MLAAVVGKVSLLCECVAGTVIIASEWSCRSSPDGAQEESGNGEGLADGADRGLDGDPEGVWSPDIEQSFQEALAIYPPCGRRKIILSDEGKMYGRNELIARYIKLRTGKTRTRKQVSSHIQVLARKRVREYQASIKVSSHLQVLAKRKSREFQSKLKAMNLDQVSKDKALQTVANLSSAQIVSASVMKPQTPFPPPVRYWPGPVPGQPGHSQDIKPFAQPPYTTLPAPVPPPISYETLPPPRPTAIAAPVWQDRTIASAKLRLLEYSAFMESQKDRETVLCDNETNADLSGDIEEGPSAFYGVSSQYSGTENITISVSTKVCSFGKQVVEKVETEHAQFEGGKYMFRIHRSPMCEYMINFIHKLKHLPEKYMMNSVLENFTILQVVSNRDTQETLLCIAFVFEVSTSEHGAQYHVYRLVND
ncbi:transcriptional enhancer factor TEF-5 isoform X8 [Poecilia latipinna]|uniref:transcriptional enhancer factor TEF-5-like isoform X8 n=1 Tax=Poecilia mexicana TaxID=48701 RepID=UPI00072E403C|nr:PREDICTED: transcriptional enhancer factor TEF-5-like isoform X8 [Poecilia mexicana]XP_014886644.1 PREDICTED: transcriptional enhancer factor TEF-5-like isoform X8 [Poecilia latipinna]XP_016535583.1 PREDICTED: transcriptional enhancer factor TEF-5-like isoform X8 [Poecilia formosa]